MSPLAWCAVLLVSGGWCLAAPAPRRAAALLPAALHDVDDFEEIGSYMGGGGGGGGWEAGAALRPAADPALYFLDDLPIRAQRYDGRAKRKMPSLSISNPMEVLRQRLVLEIARKQMRENAARQAEENRLFLQNVGKRGIWGDGTLDLNRDN